MAFAAFADPIVWKVYAWGPVGWAFLSLVVLVAAGWLGWRLLRWRRRRRAQSTRR